MPPRKTLTKTLVARGSRRYEYRLVWGYKGSKAKQVKIAQQPTRVLRMLRRLATDEPWMGASIGSLRKAWNHLQLRTEVAWEAVSERTLRDVMLAIQQTYPELDYIRVEFRQVGPWVEQLDPMRTLRTVTSEAADVRQLALVDKVEGMSREELDTWRMVPPSERGDLRTPTERRRYTRGNKYSKAALDRQPRGVEGAAAAAEGGGDTSAADDTRLS